MKAGELWPATLMTTEFFQTNRKGALQRLKFKHLGLHVIDDPSLAHPEPVELVEYYCTNQKRTGYDRKFKALCVPHVDPTICPVWFTAAQLVGMHTRMPGFIRSIVDGDMVDEPILDFESGAGAFSRQPLWWGYSLYPAGRSEDGIDPARGEISDSSVHAKTKNQLKQLPEQLRPKTCTHAGRYGGLLNLQNNGCDRTQQERAGQWHKAEHTMMHRYGFGLNDLDAALRASGQVPGSNDPPGKHHKRPADWPTVRKQLIGQGFAKEVGHHRAGYLPGPGRRRRSGHGSRRADRRRHLHGDRRPAGR